jgi:hypothetical protein
MNADQQNKLAMYLAVKAICDAAQAIWTPLAAFATHYTAFLAKTGLIQQLAAAQAADRTGAARDKAGIQETLADAVLTIGGALTAYATVKGDQTLKEKVDLSRYAFLRQRDVEMAGTADLIHSEASSRLALLAPYGVTQLLLDDLDDKIDAYSAIAEAPRAGIAGRKTLTTQLEQEFRKADVILRDILDRLALQFKTTAPTFHSDYTNARIIIDRPGGLPDPQPAPPNP